MLEGQGGEDVVVLSVFLLLHNNPCNASRYLLESVCVDLRGRFPCVFSSP